MHNLENSITSIFLKLFKPDMTLKSFIYGFQVNKFANSIKCIAVSIKSGDMRIPACPG